MSGKANEWNDGKMKRTDIRIEIKKKTILEATNWEWINQTMTVTEGQHLTLKACLHIQDEYTHLWLFFC